MAHVTVDDKQVAIHISGLDAVWALHGSMNIPLEHITGARAEDENAWAHMWGKLAGTNAPGLKMAGTFWFPEGLAFLDYGNGKGCLVLETTHESYKTIIVQPDADTSAADLAAKINARAASKA